MFVRQSLAILALLGTSIAWAGNGTSGGGQAVVYPDGTVKFLDLIPQNELPRQVMSDAAIQKQFYSKNRYVKTLASEMPGFFDCARERLAQFGGKIPALDRLAEEISDVRPLAVEFRLLKAGSAGVDQDVAVAIPVVAPGSHRIPVEFQEPVASYVKGNLWISGRIYAAMNDQDRCATAVHEAFRHLNYGSILARPLSTSEIEKATRLVMGTAFAGESFDGIRMQLAQNRRTADQVRGAADRKSQEAAKIAKDLAENRYKTAQEIYDAVVRIGDLHVQAAELETQAVDRELGEPIARMQDDGIGLAGSVALSTAMSDRLPVGKYFDVVSLKFVHRAF